MRRLWRSINLLLLLAALPIGAGAIGVSKGAGIYSFEECDGQGANLLEASGGPVKLETIAWPKEQWKKIERRNLGNKVQVDVRELLGPGGVTLPAGASFSAGEIYLACVTVESINVDAKVEVSLRESQPPYERGAVDLIDLKRGSLSTS